MIEILDFFEFSKHSTIESPPFFPTFTLKFHSMSRFGLLFLVFMCFGTAFSQVPSYVPTNGLVGWWPFNGNANDESGNGNNGVIIGSITPSSDRFGNPNKSYNFLGNGHIQLSSINLPSFTINVWIKRLPGVNGITVICKHYASSVSNSSYLLFSQSSQDNFCTPNMYYTSTTNVPASINATGSSWCDDKWHMITGVLSSSALQIYFDGQLINTTSGAISKSTSFATLIGAQYSNTGVVSNQNFGQIDDVGFWNRALIGQEILNLYNAGPFDVSASTTTVCTGQPTTLSVQTVTGTITALNCASATNTGTLVAGTASSGVSSSIPYTGGNGGTHNGQIVSSTGVTGLTATLTSGTFASGNGSLTYTISGTPSASGTASFALNIGGQTCSVTVSVQSALVAQYPANSVLCASGPTDIVDVTNPTTGKTWMDRNLGASQKATSSSDANSYGDLYQWGRRSDGHQCRNSTTTSTLSSTDQPSHGSFILTNGSPNDWRSPQNNTRWQGVNGVNNPCPSGYRIPTVAEFDAERLSWISNNAAGAIASPLKLPMAGRRVFNTGSINPGSPSGFYWTSGVSLPYCQDLVFSATSALPASNLQWITFGNSVRCIKN